MKNKPKDITRFRKKAEELLASRPTPPEVSAADKNVLIHELRVHQIELEMQNEELRQSRVALDNAIKKYSDLYDFAPVGYITMDRDTAIIEANLMASELLKIERRDLIGKPFNVFVSSDDKDIFYLHLKKLTEQVALTCEIKLKRKNGDVFNAQLVSILFPEEDDASTNRMMAIFDITARTRIEQALARHSAELIASNKGLEAFAYSISHDLRNPLHAILTISDVIKNSISSNDKDNQEGLDHIMNSCKSMARIIDDLMSLSRISLQETIFTKCSLSDMALSIIEGIKSRDNKRKVDILIEPELNADADEGLIRILMQNLIQNAWKFTSKKKDARIEFGQESIGESQFFYVRDNGVGFDMKQADKLFKPFQRLHSQEDYAGTGIGLTIVKRIVEKHGGTIKVESEKGEGTTFYFSLNLYGRTARTIEPKIE
jgi:PAS domain S-box-containing protein